MNNALKAGRDFKAWSLLVCIAVIAFILWPVAGEAPALPIDVRTNDRLAETALATTGRHQYLRTDLTLGGPAFANKFGCIFCRLSRESGADVRAIDHPSGGPSRVILMRHADKPDDPEDEDLSEAGMARAEHLASYVPQTFGKPDYIIATAHSKHSNRPIETVKPLAEALGINFQHNIGDDDFEELVKEIFANPAYHGKTVVVCWHHGKLPAIAALLGAPAGSYPDPWPEDAYNIILDLRYDPNSGSPPTVTRVLEPF
jgi:phosphohistidine phosphatase SixA